MREAVSIKSLLLHFFPYANKPLGDEEMRRAMATLFESVMFSRK
jgi:hypothetical protein